MHLGVVGVPGPCHAVVSVHSLQGAEKANTSNQPFDELPIRLPILRHLALGSLGKAFGQILIGFEIQGKIDGGKQWDPISHGGKPFSTVGNHFPRWETIFHGGKPFPTVGNRFPRWAFLLA